MFNANIRNLVQQLLRLLRIAVNPLLALRKELSTSALDHVAEQRPGRAAEANQRHAPGQLLPGERDGLVHVPELGLDVHFPAHHLAVLAVAGVLERVWKVRALLLQHLDDHSHGLGDHEDVGEDDGGVEEAGVALDGLEGDCRSDLGIAADLEEVAVAFGFVVLGEITTSYRYSKRFKGQLFWKISI